LFHIKQLTPVEDYVARFSELMDKIAACEERPDPLHYTTRFLDGLKPGVRVLVAIQQPRDLDAAYTLALLYEELGDNTSSQPYQHYSGSSGRRSLAAPPVPPPPPAKWVSRSVEEKRNAEAQRSFGAEKWNSLKAYRRARGLCFTCGEQWSREHQCKPAIQLHIVQEMIDCMTSSGDSDTGEEFEHLQQQEHTSQQQQLMMLSSAAISTAITAPRTMQLQVDIQGHALLFLVDSGSSACFIDSTKASLFTGAVALAQPIPVKVAGGAILFSTHFFPQLQWSADGA
jgi:hypothetical protein